MPDTMIVMPRTSSPEEAHEAALELLEIRCDQAMLLAEDLRSAVGVPTVEGSRLARTMRRTALAISDAMDERELSTDEVHALIGSLHPLVVEAERIMMASDVRLAVEPDVYEQVEASATAIGHFAIAAFAEFLGKVDLERLMAVEREAPVALMHAFQRVIADGYLHARTHTSRPTWLQSQLARSLGQQLDGVDLRERRATLVSPFVTITARAVLDVDRRWKGSVPTRTTEQLAQARTASVDATASSIELQRERLGVLPDLATWFDIGHAYGMIEPLIDELAYAQDVEPPRSASAPLWFDLLMAPDVG